MANRVVSIEYDPTYKKTLSLDISNTLELVSDSITAIQHEKVSKNAVYNGVKIGPTDGFVSERSDGKVKIIMNATEGISVYSDTGSGLEKIFYIDVNGKMFIKDVDATGTFTYATKEVATEEFVTNAIAQHVLDYH